MALREATPRLHLPVAAVQPGDFTHVTGFRRVAAVQIKPRRQEVVLTWVDGDRKTFLFDHVNKVGEVVPTILKVLRPAAA